MHFPFSLKSSLPALSALRGVARIIVLLALAAGLGACSAIKLGYNNLDELAYWWLDGYVDFTDEQTSRVRDDLARLHYWHRSVELPQVMTFLRRMEELAPGDIDAQQVCTFFDRARERLNVVAERAEPAAVTLAITFTPEQFAHLERKYSKNNADYRKNWAGLTPDELQEKRLTQFLERSEMMYGRLDEAQRAVLRRQLERSIFDAKRLLAERQRRQQDALQTLRKMTTPSLPLSEARGLLRAYLQRAQESPDAAYRRYQQALINEGCRNIAVLHNSTSAAQRESAVRRLRAYQRDLRELAGQQQ